MKNLVAIIIKFVVIGTVLFSFLAIYNASITKIFFLVLLTTGVSYLVGDLFILPRFGSIAAGFGDFVLAFASVWPFSYLFIEPTFNIVVTSFFAAAAITVSEIFFHIYMKNRILGNHKGTQLLFNVPATNKFSTEFSEEYSEPELERMYRKQENTEK